MASNGLAATPVDIAPEQDIVADSPAATPSVPVDAAARMFTVGGFGALGVVHSSDYRADFTATAFDGTGAGNTRCWSPAVDRLLGLQADGRFSSKVSAVFAGHRRAELQLNSPDQCAVKGRTNPERSTDLADIAVIVVPTDWQEAG
jgi:hypothetical protein